MKIVKRFLYGIKKISIKEHKNRFFLFCAISVFSALSEAQTYLRPGQSVTFGNHEIFCGRNQGAGNSDQATRVCSCQRTHDGHQLVLSVINKNGSENRIVLKTYYGPYPAQCEGDKANNRECR